MVMPFPIEGYQLSLKNYISLIEEGHGELNEWLYSWEQCSENCIRSVSSSHVDMPFVVAKQSIMGTKQSTTDTERSTTDTKQSVGNSKQPVVSTNQAGMSTNQAGMGIKQPNEATKESDTVTLSASPISNQYQSGHIKMFE